MFGLYLFGAAIIVSVGLFIIGRKQGEWEMRKDEQGYSTGTEPFDMIWPMIFVTIFWPIVLAVACFIGPFIGFFYLGFRSFKNK